MPDIFQDAPKLHAYIQKLKKAISNLERDQKANNGVSIQSLLINSRLDILQAMNEAISKYIINVTPNSIVYRYSVKNIEKLIQMEFILNLDKKSISGEKIDEYIKDWRSTGFIHDVVNFIMYMLGYKPKTAMLIDEVGFFKPTPIVNPFFNKYDSTDHDTGYYSDIS